MDGLMERWQATWAALERTAPDGLLERLLAAWREPQRHYHTLQHLEECLVLFDEVRAGAEHPGEIELALWFHDAVYDVHAHDNEARSAQWADEALAAAGIDAQRRHRIHDLIMATCHTAHPASPDAMLLTDIDLAILGAPDARFAQYQQQIRAEYGWVAQTLYAAKRNEILQGFLDRQRIYATPVVRQLFEVRARRNLMHAVSAQE